MAFIWVLSSVILSHIIGVEAVHKQHVCPAESWSDQDGICYFISRIKVAFSSAEYLCKQEGAHLASILTREENDLVVGIALQSFTDNNVVADDYFIGLTDLGDADSEIYCEGAASTSIGCSSGGVIKVTYAYYGRTDGTTCQIVALDEACFTTNYQSDVAEECDGKTMCSHMCTFSSDPCPGKPKYCNTTYICAQNGSWTDGSVFSYQNYDVGEPDADGNSCITVDPDGSSHYSKWFAQSCSSPNYYACEYEKDCSVLLEVFSYTMMLSSPGAGIAYNSHAHCTWYLQGTGKAILLDFTSFDVACDFDYVQVYNGWSSDAPPLTDKLCGTTLPTQVSTSQGLAALVFRTDGSGQSVGFAVQYRSGNQACGERFLSSNDTGYQVGIGTASFVSGLSCVWTFEDDAGTHGTLGFEVVGMDADQSTGCTQDYVEVRLGSDESGQLVQRYCDATPLEIALPGQHFWINLVKTTDTPASTNFIFEGTFHACGGMRDTEGVISSPNYPLVYPTNSRCAWQLKAPSNNQILVTFGSRFSVAGTPPWSLDDPEDYLEIYDGGLATSNLLGRFCGTTPPADILSQTNEIFVAFYSDAGGPDTAPGFEITFTFITDGAQPCKSVAERDSATVQLPFESLSGGQFTDGTYTVSTIKGSPALVEGVVGTALSLDGATVLTLGQGRDTCFTDPSLCTNGATFAMWIKYSKTEAGKHEMLQVLGNGGQTAESYGWSVFIDAGVNRAGLVIDVSTKTQWATLIDFTWSTDSARKEDVWIHTAFVLDNVGLTLYENGEFVRYNALEDRRSSISSSVYNNFLLGAPNDEINADYYKGRMHIDELVFWDSEKDVDFIKTLYVNYDNIGAVCAPPYECVDDVCVCPIPGLECGASVSLTSDNSGSSPVLENTVVQFSCVTNAQPSFNTQLMVDNGTSSNSIAAMATDQSTHMTTVTLSRGYDGGRFYCKVSSAENASIFMDSEESFVYTVHYGPDNIVFEADTPDTASVPENTMVELSCSVEANPPPLMSIVMVDTEGNTETVAELTEAGLAIAADILLTKQQNQITYNCRVVYQSAVTSSDTSFTYNVTHAATVVDIAATVTTEEVVLEDSVTTITCSTDSNPPSQLALVVTNTTGTELYTKSEYSLSMAATLTLSRDYHEATIVCSAEPGSLSSETLVYTVAYGPDNIVFEADTPDTASLPENTMVELSCSVEANPPPLMSIVMVDTEGNIETVAEQTEEGLSFDADILLTKQQNQITYYCRIAHQTVLTLSDNSFTYNVTYAATAVAIAATVSTEEPVLENRVTTVTCSADSNPPSNLALVVTDTTNTELYRTSEYALRLDATLTLSRDYDQATIVCSAEPGSLSSETLVYRLASSTETPVEEVVVVFSSTISDGSVFEAGTEVTFSCSTTGSTADHTLAIVQVSSSQSLHDAVGTSLSHAMEITKEFNQETFICRASSTSVGESGTDSVNRYTYTVEFPPTEISLTISPSNTVTEGTDVALTCVTDPSNPLLPITWTANNTALASDTDTAVNGTFNAQYATSQVSVVADISLNNTLYRCTAGNLNDSVSLNVLAKESDNSLAIGLGVAGAVVVLVLAGGILVIIVLKSSTAAAASAPLAQAAQGRSYIPRGYRNKPLPYGYM